MRVADEKLIQFALRALEEAAGAAMLAPVERTFAIRLALAYLASRHSCERWPFDQFWQALPYEQHRGRRASITASLNGIYVQIGRKRG